MLDEGEYAQVSQLYDEAARAANEYRQRWDLPLKHTPVHELYRPVRTRYEELTGMKDCHQNAVRHHRISLYGPPCKRCGKPLRTPGGQALWKLYASGGLSLEHERGQRTSSCKGQCGDSSLRSDMTSERQIPRFWLRQNDAPEDWMTADAVN
jgi:hypothetical protein